MLLGDPPQRRRVERPLVGRFRDGLVVSLDRGDLAP